MDPQNPVTYFAETDARNKKVKFGIKAKDRLRHTYVIGKTGMGKSTLLENLAVQDIQNGNGLAVIDPHGSMAEKLLEYVPEDRIKDVLYFAPFDMEYPISFNVMEDVTPDKRHLVVNGLMATFEKIWSDAWSARMAYILQYAIIALLEYPDSSLLSINRMLSDKEYRKKVVDNVTDASAKSFWVDEFGKYTERFAAEATPAIQNKVGQFTSNALVRNIIGQPKSSFDIRKMMDEKKILIINLSKGQVGELNARLIGSMLITKIYLAAMSRADLSESDIAKLPNFYLYVDEFQSFANKSFADILSEARKYKLGLIVAHQYIEQMEEEVRDAVFGNVGTMITFRVGSFDAEVLEKEFAPVFTAEDLVNLGFAQIYLKLMIDGVSSSPFSATTLSPIGKPEVSFKDQVLESSRKTYGRLRADVENDINKFYEQGRGAVPLPNNSIHTNQSHAASSGFYSNNNGNGGGRNENAKPFGQNQNQFRPRQETDLRAPIGPDHELNAPQIPRKDVLAREENKMAFIKAKEELEQRGQKPEIAASQKQTVSAMASSPYVQEQPLQPGQKTMMSLKDLKPEHERAKIPTKENVESLKDALAKVMGRPIEEKKPQVAVPKVEYVAVKNPEPEIKTEIKNKEPNTQKEIPPQKPPQENKKQDDSKNFAFDNRKSTEREVPEDVLRKLLDVEPPKMRM